MEFLVLYVSGRWGKKLVKAESLDEANKKLNYQTILVTDAPNRESIGVVRVRKIRGDKITFKNLEIGKKYNINISDPFEIESLEFFGEEDSGAEKWLYFSKNGYNVWIYDGDTTRVF